MSKILVLVVMVVVVVPGGLIGHETYRYQNLVRCPQGTTGVRARDMGTHNYFEGYWTLENPGDVDARAVIYFLDPSNGAPACSLVVTVEAGGTYADYLRGDSCSFTNFDLDDTCQVSVRGDRSVNVYGK